jgi:hypothetical protein
MCSLYLLPDSNSPLLSWKSVGGAKSSKSISWSFW